MNHGRLVVWVSSHFYILQVNCHRRKIVWARIASIRKGLYIPSNEFWFDGINWMRFGFAIHVKVH